MEKLFVIIFSFHCLSTVAQTDDSVFARKLRERGVRMVAVRDGKYKIFTQKINTGKNKLLLLPGGPGSSFEYFEVFPKFLSDNYEIYFYSPLSSFLSDQPSDSSIQTVNSYVEDLEEVRTALNIDSFYLLGHSWGGSLALAYAAKYQKHLKGLILSNCTGLSGKLLDFESYQQKLTADIVETIPELRQYSDSIRNNLMNEQSRPELMNTIMKQVRPLFIKQHFLRLDSIPDALIRSRTHTTNQAKLKWLIKDSNNKDFSTMLSTIYVPTLFIGGQFDFTPPKYGISKSLMTKAKSVTIYITPNGSHRSMWDDSLNYFTTLRAFVENVNKHYR